jgi:transcription elongation factor Elf1
MLRCQIKRQKKTDPKEPYSFWVDAYQAGKVSPFDFESLGKKYSYLYTFT